MNMYLLDHRGHRVHILLIVLLIESACSMKPNIRELVKGPVTLEATRNFARRSDEWEYYSLRISKITAELDISIEMDAGEVIGLDNINRDYLLGKTNAVINTPKESELTSIIIMPYRFWMIEDKLKAIDVGWTKGREPRPVLWITTKHKRFPFPLSDKDVGEMFGKPDKVIDRFEW